MICECSEVSIHNPLRQRVMAISLLFTAKHNVSIHNPLRQRVMGAQRQNNNFTKGVSIHNPLRQRVMGVAVYGA